MTLCRRDEIDALLKFFTLLLVSAKKNLAPSAMAGLAIKLDLGTVKLRKTGIVEQMLSDKAGRSLDNPPVSPNPALGLEYNTKHPVMLLQIKGTVHVHVQVTTRFNSASNLFRFVVGPIVESAILYLSTCRFLLCLDLTLSASTMQTVPALTPTLHSYTSINLNNNVLSLK